MSKEAMKLALEALEKISMGGDPRWADDVLPALREALAVHPAQREPVKWSDYEPDGMHHNKPQKRPQNCGTGYCSCIECVMEPVAWMTKDGEIYKSACWPEHEARPLVFGDTPQAKRTCPDEEPVKFAFKESNDSTEVLRVTPEGEFIWHPDTDKLLVEGDFSQSPALPHILRAMFAQRTWVGLTDEEIESIFNNWPTYHLDHEDFARVIEAKLKEKNT